MLFCVRAPNPAGPNGSQPSRPSPASRKRRRDRDLALGGEQHRDAEQRDAARELEHGGELARVGLEIFLRHPQQDGERHEPEQQSHRYLICASSFCAPALRRAERSASALTPPAA